MISYIDSVEQTLVIIKPDGVARRIVGEIITRLEKRTFEIKRIEMVKPCKEQLILHYGEHLQRPYFDDLIKYMQSGPIIVIVLEGYHVISNVRNMIGSTNPVQAAAGTIRGDFGSCPEANIIHASDNRDSAKREIKIWYPDHKFPDLAYCDALKFEL